MLNKSIADEFKTIVQPNISANKYNMYCRP